MIGFKGCKPWCHVSPPVQMSTDLSATASALFFSRALWTTRLSPPKTGRVPTRHRGSTKTLRSARPPSVFPPLILLVLGYRLIVSCRGNDLAEMTRRQTRGSRTSRSHRWRTKTGASSTSASKPTATSATLRPRSWRRICSLGAPSGVAATCRHPARLFCTPTARRSDDGVSPRPKATSSLPNN